MTQLYVAILTAATHNWVLSCA